MENKHSTVRVRFAPSPTGHLHIGGLRTALFNFLFARHNNGQFLLRIEDTDKERSRQEYTDAIMQALTWTSLLPDEPVVLQSTHIEEHKKLIQKLLDEGKAYKCYCTIGLGASKDEYMLYDGKCRTVKVSEDLKDKPYVVRIKLPIEQKTITFDDLIRGEITFDLNQFDDFIIARSNGTPVYNFVVVVDDHGMNITHVIRGEDHISNTPKQIVLYKALGFDVPQFAHIPLILGPTGKRLSKRDAATSVLDYKKQGYLPDALCNYLARLGWAYKDQEIFSRDELISLFTLEGVGKKGSIFDQEKLNWLNAYYIKESSSDVLLQYIIESVDSLFLQKVADWDKDKVFDAISLYKARVNTLLEMINALTLLHDGPATYNEKEVDKWVSADTVNLLTQLRERLEAIETFTSDNIAVIFKSLCKDMGVKLVMLAQPVRLALTGTTASPGIFDIIALLNKDVVIKRIDSFILYIKKRS